MSTHAALRAATAAEHEKVDAAFGRYDLGTRAGYGAFLAAHARALPAVERALEGEQQALPPLRPRTALLLDDLAALGTIPPAPFELSPPTNSAAAFGMAYVIEGSRLGGGLIARQVADGLPHAYLSAVHLPGEWRAFGQAIDRAGAAGGAEWEARAIAAAKATFDLYARAAVAG